MLCDSDRYACIGGSFSPTPLSFTHTPREITQALGPKHTLFRLVGLFYYVLHASSSTSPERSGIVVVVVVVSAVFVIAGAVIAVTVACSDIYKKPDVNEDTYIYPMNN